MIRRPVGRRLPWQAMRARRMEQPVRHRPYRAALWLLAGYLLFVHGCHGDEDNELLAGDANRALSALRLERSGL
jgi:hypothetical protein